jgi:TPR repeat protein
MRTKRAPRWGGRRRAMLRAMFVAVALSATAGPAAGLDAAAVAKLEAKAQAGDAAARLALGEHYLAGDRSAEERATGERWLRKIVIDKPEEQMLAAVQALHTQLEPIRAKYADVKPTQGSVGIALDQAGRYDESVDVLIREAWLLMHTAQIYLDKRYSMQEEGAVMHDPRIRAYFEASADEGLAQSRVALAYILIDGAGVEPDAPRAMALLEQVGAQGFPQAYMDLSRLSNTAGDPAAAERWCEKAAALGDTRGFYCVGMYASSRGEDEKAFQSLAKVRELDPDATSVQVQLAMWHLDGKGTPRNPEKGFAMMKQVADGDSEDRVEAQAHVGAMYATGTGVEKSPQQGHVYLEKAAAAGHEGAADWLTREAEAGEAE